MRDRRLQGIEAIVERQQRVAAESDDDRLVLDGQHRGLGIFWPGLQIGDGAALPPFGNGLGIDAISLGKVPQALLTMLYRSTDRLCRCGAAVKNLSHSASLESGDKGAPSNPGIKQLGYPYTVAYSLHVNCIFHQLLGDATAVRGRSEELVVLATEQGFPH